MTLDDRVQEVMDLIEMAFDSDVALLPDSTIKSIGLDSLETTEFILLVDSRWPDADMSGYQLTAETSVRDIAAEVERRLSA